jgi:hypothetical protein
MFYEGTVPLLSFDQEAVFPITRPIVADYRLRPNVVIGFVGPWNSRPSVKE